MLSAFLINIPLSDADTDGVIVNTRGKPRPDEVDLTGTNVWKKNTDVPSHNNLGFRVLTGASLYIYSGVTVKFDPGTQLLVEGRLYITGSKDSIVTLTSNAASPDRGDWGGIKFMPGSLGYVNHSSISYSILGVNLIGTTNVKVANCSITNVQLGVKIENNATYNIIEKNNVSNSDAGMAIYASNNNRVQKNKINDLDYSGLTISDQAYRNYIISNQLATAGERGVSLSGNANNNTFLSNSILSNTGEGFRSTGASDNIFNNNMVYSNNAGFIFYSGSNNNRLINNQISQNTEAALDFKGGDNCILINNELSSNGFGILASSIKNLEADNVTIESSTSADIDLSNGAVLRAINCSFQESMVFVRDTSKLWVYWYLILELRDTKGALKAAKVRVVDNNNILVRPSKIVPSGICWVKCLGFTQDAARTDKSMNPHWFTAKDDKQEFRIGVDLSERSKRFTVRFSVLPTTMDFPEDTKLELDLLKYFNKFEKTSFTVKVISGGNLSYAFDEENLKLMVTPPDNWNGEESIEISAKPNLGDTDKRITKLNVTAVNDPPVIDRLIPNQLKLEDPEPWHLNLAGYVSDPDMIYGDNHSWSFSGINYSWLNLTVNNKIQRLNFKIVEENVWGSDQITLELKDSTGDSDCQTIWVNITPKNDLPELLELEMLPNTGTLDTDFQFKIKYLDADGDLPDYITIKLDNMNSYQMEELKPADDDVTDGKVYQFTTKLTSKPHYFWIECHDGNGGYASTGNKTGPIVTSSELGSLSGAVREKGTEKGIAGAMVVIIDLQNGSSQNEITTDSEGNYIIINLQPGINRYQIFASADGFYDSKVFNRTIIKGAVSVQNFALERLPGDVVDTTITKTSIQANRTEINQYEAISFIGFAEDLDGDILTFNWDFDDDSGQFIGKEISHAFYMSGEFNVILTVFDTDGNNLTGNLTITVAPDPYSKDDDDSSDLDTYNMTALALVLILIILILLLIVFYSQVRRRNAEEAARIEEEERRIRKFEKAAARRKRKRERDMDYVDREKRNVEQVNFLISELHREREEQEKIGKKGKSRGKSKGKDEKGKGKRKEKGRQKQKREMDPVDIDETDNVFEIIEEPASKSKKSKAKVKSSSKRNAKKKK
jgi:parallel beta-helix repeat protein